MPARKSSVTRKRQRAEERKNNSTHGLSLCMTRRRAFLSAMILTLFVFLLGSFLALMPFPAALPTTLVLTAPVFLIAFPATLAIMSIAARCRSRVNTRGHS
jgi:Kef-type K+ transport system membrane component KefB